VEHCITVIKCFSFIKQPVTQWITVTASNSVRSNHFTKPHWLYMKAGTINHYYYSFSVFFCYPAFFSRLSSSQTGSPKRKPLRITGQGSLQAHGSTNSVKAIKETQCTKANHRISPTRPYPFLIHELTYEEIQGYCNLCLLLTTTEAMVNKKSQSNLGRAMLPPLTVENNYATKSHWLQLQWDASHIPKTNSSPLMISTPI